MKPVSMDDIIRKCGRPAFAKNAALLSREMKRLIRQLPGMMFLRNQ